MKKVRLNRWATSLKKNTYALYLASRDDRVSKLAKIMIGLVVAYALSPIDLIPDFIPVLGYVDDLLLLPLGIMLSIRLIPPDVWHECQDLAAESLSDLPRNRRAAFVIICIWLLAMAGLMIWLISILSDQR